MALPTPLITIPTSQPYFSTNMNLVFIGGTYTAGVGITSILVNGTSADVFITGAISGNASWGYQASLINGDNLFTVIATDGVTYSSADSVTIIYNSGLSTAIAPVPTGISIVQGRNVVNLNTPFPNDQTNFQGFNFYGSEDTGGGTEGYTLLNTSPDFTAAYSQNNTTLVSQTVTQVGTQQTTVTVQNILTIDYAQYVHNRVTQPLGPNPINTANYYVMTTVFYDPNNNALIESPYSEELPGTPIVINTQLAQITPRTQNDFTLSMLDQILAANATFDIKPGTVLRDTVVDPAATLFSNLFTIISFIHTSQSFPTLIAFDDPNGTGTSADVATTPGKAQLAQALLIPTTQADTVQTLIDTAFDMLAGNVNKTRNPATSAIGTLTVFTTSVPSSNLTVQPGAIVQTTADTVNGVPSVQFQTMSGFVLQVASLSQYFNPTTNRYEFTLNIQAVVPGASGNVNAGAITSVVSGFSSGLGVINNNPTEFGTDEESNESLATRAQLAFLSVDSGTAAGYFSHTIGVQGVTRALVIGAGNPLMQRDLDPIRRIHALGKVDIYVQGTITQQITETIGFTYDTVIGEQFFVQSALLFQFVATNTNISGANPIFLVTQVTNVTRSANYDLTGYTITGDGNVIQLNPLLPLNIFVGLNATDVISVNYTYRDSPPIVLGVQPVQSIISVTGNLSGPLTSANYALIKQDDPLILGNSTEANDEVVFTYANGIPNGQLNVVTNEQQTLVDIIPNNLALLGVIINTIVVTDITSTITYTLNVDYLIIPGTSTTQTQIERTGVGAIPNGATVLVSYQAGETMQIVYVNNSLLNQVQAVINVMRHITADVLVKGAQATLINIEMTVALAIGADPTTVDTNIRDAIGNQLASSPLGRSIYQSDIVSLTEKVTGVLFVAMPLTLMGKADGTQVIREELTDPEFTVYQNGLVTSYVSTEALLEPTTIGGGPANLFRGIFEDDFPLVTVASDTEVANAAGQGFIRADGRIIVSTALGNDPNLNVYTVTYVVEGETGSNDILITSIEYGYINSLQITYTQTNQSFQGF